MRAIILSDDEKFFATAKSLLEAIPGIEEVINYREYRELRDTFNGRKLKTPMELVILAHKDIGKSTSLIGQLVSDAGRAKTDMSGAIQNTVFLVRTSDSDQAEAVKEF